MEKVEIARRHSFHEIANDMELFAASVRGHFPAPYAEQMLFGTGKNSDMIGSRTRGIIAGLICLTELNEALEAKIAGLEQRIEALESGESTETTDGGPAPASDGAIPGIPAPRAAKPRRKKAAK